MVDVTVSRRLPSENVFEPLYLYLLPFINKTLIKEDTLDNQENKQGVCT